MTNKHMHARMEATLWASLKREYDGWWGEADLAGINATDAKSFLALECGRGNGRPAPTYGSELTERIRDVMCAAYKCDDEDISDLPDDVLDKQVEMETDLYNEMQYRLTEYIKERDAALRGGKKVALWFRNVGGKERAVLIDDDLGGYVPLETLLKNALVDVSHDDIEWDSYEEAKRHCLEWNLRHGIDAAETHRIVANSMGLEPIAQ